MLCSSCRIYNKILHPWLGAAIYRSLSCVCSCKRTLQIWNMQFIVRRRQDGSWYQMNQTSSHIICSLNRYSNWSWELLWYEKAVERYTKKVKVSLSLQINSKCRYKKKRSENANKIELWLQYVQHRVIRQNVIHFNQLLQPCQFKRDSSVTASALESLVSLTDVSSLKRQTMEHMTGLIQERRHSEDNS